MKIKIVNSLVNTLLLIMMLSCENENIGTKVKQGIFQNGVFILNEGIFNRQNTSLSFYFRHLRNCLILLFYLNIHQHWSQQQKPNLTLSL